MAQIQSLQFLSFDSRGHTHVRTALTG